MALSLRYALVSARSFAAATVVVSLLTVCAPAFARSEFFMLALQREGQASLAIDEGAKAAYIVDLGRGGDGDQVRFTASDLTEQSLIDYLVRTRRIENLVIACSHPHSDHMGGIKALFEKYPEQFFEGGDPKRPKFKTLTVIDNGVTQSLTEAYDAFKAKAIGSDLRFNRIKVTGPDGNPRDAFAQLPFQQGDIKIANVPYAQTEPADHHGRAVVTLTELDGGTRVIDFDDASTLAIRSAVDNDKARGITVVNSFVVPHHGSRYHDIEAIFELAPKRAIISVNPSNRFGHPSAEIVERLIEKLGKDNVFFTGSRGNIELSASGMKGVHSAADPDTWALFFEGRLNKAEGMRQTAVRKEEVAALKRVRKAINPVGEPGAQVAAAARTTPGGVDVEMVDRVHATGSMLPIDIEASRVPLTGADVGTLLGDRVFPVPRGAAVYVTNTTGTTISASDRYKIDKMWGGVFEFRFQSGGGLPSPFFPPEPPIPPGFTTPPPPSPTPTTSPRPNSGIVTDLGTGSLPMGGMVFLDGGRIEMSGARTQMAGGTLEGCGVIACLKTATGHSYRLPFAASDMPLLREVLWRVNKGVAAFYLSINPRKKLLQDNFSLSQVPTAKLLHGPGQGGGDALNDVVTAGGIERSRIGDILWRADVAFKSKALGMDVLSGTRGTLDPRLYVRGEVALRTDNLVPEGDRWCRLYWGSGNPKFTFSEGKSALPSKLTVSGNAVRARAEAMVPRRGKLESFPLGGWCAREHAVARLLERQANEPAALGTLGELKRLALMQSFAMWAKRSGVNLAGLAQEPTSIAAIPGWTSGIRTPNVTTVKPERRITKEFRAYVVHV